MSERGVSALRNRAEIEAEIMALDPLCETYGTVRETHDAAIAVGAHDVLRWALGLVEEPISAVFSMSETAIAKVPAQEQEQEMGASILEVITRAAKDPLVDIGKMQQLLDMQERVMLQRAKSDFSIAMRDCQSEMRPVIRDAENSHTKSKYARMEKIDASIRPIYTQHGFSLSFDSPAAEKGQVKLVCTVRHDSGHSENYELSGGLDVSGAQGKPNKTDIQGLGSSVSYLRRYLMGMIFNIVLRNEDDDGAVLGFVDEKQQMDIGDMITECNLDELAKKKFLAYIGVRSVAEIQARDYGRAMGALQSKLRQKNGGRA